MKGIFKSLKYFSQIFDEEKEAEIQIGLPTDVKHVAHIGWEDGQAGQAVDNPSWMKEFNGSAGDSKDNSASEDSNLKGSRSDDKDPDLPKSSKRSDNPGSPKSKNKNSRRNRPKETAAADGTSVKSRDADSAAGDLPLPDIPKKTRRKKSKENVGGGGGYDASNRSTRSTRRNAAGQDSEASVKSAYSDFGEVSTRSNKRDGTASDSAADAAGAW